MLKLINASGKAKSVPAVTAAELPERIIQFFSSWINDNRYLNSNSRFKIGPKKGRVTLIK
jgi:hypothetical protein